MKCLDRFILGLGLLVGSAIAQHLCGGQTAPQYSVTVWGHKDGLPSASIRSIVQTGDGFLWLGTEDGLVRFDGVQFTPWHFATLNGQLPGRVRAVYALPTGDLLLGTDAGLLGRIRNGRFQATNLKAAVESIQPGANGSLWVATAAALWHLNTASLQPVETPLVLPGGWLSGPLRGSDGREWVTTAAGLFYAAAGKLEPVRKSQAWLVEAGKGDVALIDAVGPVPSLQGRGIARPSRTLLPGSATVMAVMRDSRNSLWVGTRGEGLFRISGAAGQASVERYTRSDGLTSDFIRSICEDREGNLWVGTENGLDRLQRNKVLWLTRRDGLGSDIVTSIAPADDGSMWLATPDGLERIFERQGRVDVPAVRILSLLMGRDRQLRAGSTAGLLEWRGSRMRRVAAFTAVTALAQDTHGVLWLFDARRGVFEQTGGHAPAAVINGALLHQGVTAMASGPDDSVWFGLAGGNIVEERGGEFRTWSAADGLSGGAIHGLSTGPQGELWAATERGLCFLSGTRFVCRNVNNGLPGDRVLWALPDAHGNLWLGYDIGVAEMNAGQLRGPAGGAARLAYRIFDDGDGMQSSPNLVGNAPAAIAEDGRLWLTTVLGVVILDPEHLQENLLAPPVHILGLEADGQSRDLTPPVRLPPLTRSIQIAFTGLGFSDPRKMRFRYRLEGFDPDWHDGGTTRVASYTNLPPGRYTFRVCASNNDGVWNNTGAALTFYLAPAWFQLVWFRLLCVATVLVAAAILFRLRLRSAQQLIRLRFEERMEERTRIAQELHDHLIQEMVGISMHLEVVDELTSGSADARKPLERALALSRAAIASGRLTLQSLRRRPVTASALLDALQETAHAYPQRPRAGGEHRINYRVEGGERMLRPEIAEDLSEVGQEALRNARKHAGGGSIRVRLHYGSSAFELLVQDEGAGMTATVLQAGLPGHFGLAGMRERTARMGADLAIVSVPGKGTTIRITVPAARAYQDHCAPGDGRTAAHRNLSRGQA